MTAHSLKLTSQAIETKKSLLASADFDLAVRLEKHLSNFINRLHQGKVDEIAGILLPTAYWHPNGFLKIPVERDADGGFFRLHYWPRESSETAIQEDIHSHRWCYFSKILRGSMKVQYFEEHITGDGTYSKYACTRNRQGSYRMDLCGRVSLDSIKTTTLRPGDVHFGKTNTIHSTMNLGSEYLITAFFQISSTSSRSYVYKKGRGSPIVHEKRKPASIESIKEALEIIDKD